VVEDDPCIREALLIELETVGFRVATAANGKEALAAIRKGPRPSVIVTDLMMPVMDGWQLRAELLRDRKLASIPVVVLTARGDAERQARSLGVEAGLAKPIDLDKLHELLAFHHPLTMH
jgi:CheY-like chemotaxis protein